MKILKSIEENRRTWITISAVVATLLLILFFIFFVVFQPYRSVGNAMEPTLKDGERFLIFRGGKVWSDIVNSDYIPERGKIVVFKTPVANSKYNYIKRIIGLPGERIVIANNVITIYNDEFPNGFELDAEWEAALADFPSDEPVIDREIDDDEVFVLGDNRLPGQSSDSRGGLGNIPIENIEGVIP